MKNQLFKGKNYGISILKLILSFFVVIGHCGIIKNKLMYKIITGRRFHVPTFMFIAFYFYSKHIVSKDIQKIKLRLFRLFIPYIIWPIVILIFNNALLFLKWKSQFKRILTIRDLILQLFLGCKYHLVFWFQINIILLTFFFTILFFLLNKNIIFILIIIEIISYVLQYSDFNYIFFHRFKYPLYQSFGCISEMLPISINGIIFSGINFKTSKTKIIIVFSLILYFFILYDIFLVPKGFLYPGIRLNIQAILLFYIFTLLFSFEIIKNNKIKNFINFITNYTGGVYYLHIVVRDYLSYIIPLIKRKTLRGCIIIYIICYLLCFIGAKCFKKRQLKYLFS